MLIARRLIRALDSFPASDEVNNLDLISFFQRCLLPIAPGHHRLVEFDCDSLRRQRQRIEQFVERQGVLWKLALLAIDLYAHAGSKFTRDG